MEMIGWLGDSNVVPDPLAEAKQWLLQV